MPAELSANLERFDGIRFGHKPEGDVENIVDYYFKARGESFGTEIKRRIIIGTYVLSAGYMDAYYKKAQKVRGVILEDFKKAFWECDVIIGPVSPYPAFKIGEFIDDPLKMYTADALTIPVNAAGIPSMACPSGFTKSGLSVGLQVIAPFLGEGRLFSVAEALRGL
jgi:aspartyl-tRNA(Asn)/glutamyl-tRNA(Gln) amidotransferase subunit A